MSNQASLLARITQTAQRCEERSNLPANVGDDPVFERCEFELVIF